MTQTERNQQVAVALDVFRALKDKAVTATQASELLKQLGINAVAS